MLLDSTHTKVQGQRLDFGILLERSPGPSCNVGIASAINDNFRPHRDQAILVCDLHRRNSFSRSFHSTNERIEQDAQ